MIGPHTLYRKLHSLARELRRPDLSRGDFMLHLAQRAMHAARLHPYIQIYRRVSFELHAPPRVLRVLRDLVVRQAGPGDLEGLAAVESTPALLIRQRLDRGDLVYVGQLDGRILCHVWFHRGPQPFDEDLVIGARWDLDRDTFWSYAAASSADSKHSGVFVKVFQTALHELFTARGARRVQAMVRHNNLRSILLHERLGFRRLGILTSIGVPGLRWVRWEGPLRERSWIVPLGGSLTLPLPPVESPASAGLA